MAKSNKTRKRVEDADLPEQGAEFFKRAQRMEDVMPDLAAHAVAKRSPGRPKVDQPKVPVSLRVDPGLLEAYKATGRGWQRLVHQALEAYEVTYLAKKGVVPLGSVVRRSGTGQFKTGMALRATNKKRGKA